MSDDNIVICCDPHKLNSVEQNNTLLQKLRDVITEIQNVEMQQAKNYHVSIRTINFRVLKYVANELNLPWIFKPDEKGVYMHPENAAKIDEKWNKCLQSFNMSHDEMNAYKLIKTDDYVNHYDLNKFISILVRRDQITRDPNSSEKILRNNDLNKLLAVDGFLGFECNDIKNYIDNLKFGYGDDSHVDTVREMYNCEKIANLSGTDSACIVFSALIEVFGKHIQDDQMKMQLNKIHEDNTSYLIKNGRYYTDIETIRNDMSKLTSFYENKMKAVPKLDQIARLKCSALLTRYKKKRSAVESSTPTMKRGRKKVSKEDDLHKRKRRNTKVVVSDEEQ